ncbi:hypothetical protein FHS76_003768 [Ochrobactrum daejeonense]|uniref:Uncharacterized protein n=1 Tax=Brucella daejeonensis TaxID=659015 RepID=A0A7W9B088_9HYPH|nr:hypothetical protein [Brucella daejeonensis]MBB5703855.1 hypothetical protein [Brucella daejeonensis]
MLLSIAKGDILKLPQQHLNFWCDGKVPDAPSQILKRRNPICPLLEALSEKTASTPLPANFAWLGNPLQKS